MLSRYVIVLCAILVSSSSLAQLSTERMEKRVLEWVEQLDSSKFSERSNATRQLQRMGAAAIKPLESVVLNGQSDAADRALGILKKNFQSDSPILSQSAGAALQRIADSAGHPKSRAAADIVRPPVTPSPNQPFRLVPPPAGGMAMANVRVSMRTINGQRDLQVDQNGEKWRFRDVGKGIAVERPDGKGGAKKAQYADEKAFEKADAEAFKMFKRYSGNGNAIRINLNGGAFPGNPFPNMRLPNMQVPGMPPVPGMQVPGGQFPDQQIPRIQIPNRQNIQPRRLRPVQPREQRPVEPKLRNADDKLIEV